MPIADKYCLRVPFSLLIVFQEVHSVHFSYIPSYFVQLLDVESSLHKEITQSLTVVIVGIHIGANSSDSDKLSLRDIV